LTLNPGRATVDGTSAGPAIEMIHMRRVALTLSVVVVAALATGVSQERPDFSGTWTMAGASPPRSTTMVVSQSAQSMTLEVTQRGKGTVRYVFWIDPAESTNSAPAEAARAAEMVSRAAWDGVSLVLSTPIASKGDAARTLKQTWSMVDGNLVITMSEINQATGEVLRETKQTFRKG
jgi:hypothetical protein